MKVELEVRSVDQKEYRKGPSAGEKYTTISGLDTDIEPWLKQVLEVRSDYRTDIKNGDFITVGVTRISDYRGVAQFDGVITVNKK